MIDSNGIELKIGDRLELTFKRATIVCEVVDGNDVFYLLVSPIEGRFKNRLWTQHMINKVGGFKI